ncbi:MAG: hypothetical protein UT44_C0041G0005 [Candidatus Levybacteria bacterium GW2011_GWA1_39_32]|nr:MAG: hypothetical protein UT44_C0041G0005 [Candidatus Levybacteria bacterium GW2011_GWA1_39_32]
MDNSAQVNKKCESVVLNVLSTLNLSEEKDIKTNLFLSIYIRSIKEVYKSPDNKELLDKITALNENVSFEDFEKVVNEGKTHLEQNSSNFPDVLKRSTVSVLQDFITELEPKLTAEKVAELRKALDNI